MNERTSAYYSYYLGECNTSVLPPNVYDPPERSIAYIKKNRENLNITLLDSGLEQIISGMRLEALASLVPLEKIPWVVSSERICLFSWCLLMQFTQNNGVKISVDSPQKNKSYFKEEHLEGNAFPSDSSTQFRRILRILDILSDKNLRGGWITQTKDGWTRAFKSKGPFGYLLSGNEHECIWTWNHLKGKNIVLEKLTSFPGSADTYRAIRPSFDMWVICLLTSPDNIRNFRNGFNKAEAQHKYKKIQEDKVNVQFSFDAETRTQLKELPRARRFSTGGMLHDLAVEEYKRYRHSR